MLERGRFFSMRQETLSGPVPMEKEKLVTAPRNSPEVRGGQKEKRDSSGQES